MYQVLFRDPIFGIPVHGFGVMLCLAFFVCTWLASRRAVKAGIAPERIQDLAIWLIVSGIVGARLSFLIDEVDKERLLPSQVFWQFFRIWDGGLILYGSVAGGIVGFVLAYFFFLRKHGISTLKVADVLAPSIALGIGLGRIGCLLNGCCYGNVACPNCPAVSYPLSAPARFALVHEGLQTAAGFLLDPAQRDKAVVEAVEPDAPAAHSGLRKGDQIVRADDRDIQDASDLSAYLAGASWPRGKIDLTLTVIHSGAKEPVELPSFRPWTLGLHPTQVYETISMFLLVCLLLAYDPLRRHDGELMALLMFGYGLHRLVNEMLRSDDRPIEFERNVSLLLIVAGLGLGVWLWRKPAQYLPAVTTRADHFTAPATSARTPAIPGPTRHGR